ncbi:MAG TPA: DUF2510 domain-containing protein [Propionibacteriaceae bacterium]
MSEALPGWYPDPAGTPGRFRYWDGSHWSTTTIGDPRQLPPAERTQVVSPPPAEGGSAGKGSRKRRLAVIIGVLAVALTTVVAAVVFGSGLPQITDASPATPAPSRLDESSPTPAATPTKSPSTSPTPQALVRCPKGDPTLRAPHPIDGRVYGGNLSFDQQPTFELAVIEQRFTFAYDVLQQQVMVSQNPAWIAQLAVGQLRAKDGFVNDPRNTVESLVQCVITGKMYRPYLPTRTDIRSESLSIDGRSGWLIDSEITVDRPDLQVKGDHVIFLVVRDGKDWGFFFGAVPIGNARLDAVLATTIRGLRAS